MSVDAAIDLVFVNGVTVRHLNDNAVLRQGRQ